MLVPRPTQISGAKFLADRQFALLADEPRVGKTGTAIIAADYIFAETILIVTTASGRAVLNRGLRDWSIFDRKTQVLTNDSNLDPRIPCAVVGWSSITAPKLRTQLLRRKWDLIIPDEDHYAKSFETKRTQAFYGTIFDDGKVLSQKTALVSTAKRVWPLTGTPLPNSPADAYPRLRALCPDRLRADPARGWPDVTLQSAFMDRYCVTRPMTIGRGSYKRRLNIVVRGRNESELNERIGDFMLLRTQQDVGILEPVYETLPLIVSDGARFNINASVDTAKVMAAIEAGDTKALEMHMGPLRRITGKIKAPAVVEHVKEEFACGLDKIVLAYWHKDVGRALMEGLVDFRPVMIDGSSSPSERDYAEKAFRTFPTTRVMCAQIQAAGEAVDFSAASYLLFVEESFIPKDMKQMSLRITNHTQKRAPLVRVAVLQGSIDEGMQTVLLRKWSSIREVLAQ